MFPPQQHQLPVWWSIWESPSQRVRTAQAIHAPSDRVVTHVMTSDGASWVTISAWEQSPGAWWLATVMVTYLLTPLVPATININHHMDSSPGKPSPQLCSQERGKHGNNVQNSQTCTKKAHLHEPAKIWIFILPDCLQRAGRDGFWMDWVGL